MRCRPSAFRICAPRPYWRSGLGRDLGRRRELHARGRAGARRRRGPRRRWRASRRGTRARGPGIGCRPGRRAGRSRASARAPARGLARSPLTRTMCSPPPAVSVKMRIVQSPPNSEVTTCSRGLAHEVVVAAAVGDQVGDRADLEPVPLGEGDELGQPGHGAVVVHDLADHARGVEPGEARDVHRGLGVAGADEDAAVAGAQREDVARRGDVLRRPSAGRWPPRRCGPGRGPRCRSRRPRAPRSRR